jgi:hypothetical protein
VEIPSHGPLMRHAQGTWVSPACIPTRACLRSRCRLACNRGDSPGHWIAQERLTIHSHEALCSQETRPHQHRASVSSGTAACVLLGAVMPAPRWAIGGMTHVVHPRGSRQTSGSLAGLRQCMVVHVSNSGGSRMWQGLLGRRPDWGIGPTRSTGVRKGSPKHTAAPVTGPRFREYFSREARAALREHFR